MLGFHFDLSAGHAHDYICQFMPILQRALEQLDVAPKRSFDTVDDFKQVIEKYNEIFVDGVEVPCVRPQDHEVQAEYYSGKKKRHTVKALVMTDQHRYIIYVSRLFGGHAHDYHLFKTEFDPQYPWFSEVETFVDLGFLGANKDYDGTIRLPHKKPRRSKNNPSPELTKAQKKENRAHSKKRIIVEHAIGGMKHFHCLTHRIRNQSETLINLHSARLM